MELSGAHAGTDRAARAAVVSGICFLCMFDFFYTMHIIVHPTGRNSFEFSVPLKLRRAYIVLQIIRCAQVQLPPKRRVYPKRLERARLTG